MSARTILEPTSISRTSARAETQPNPIAPTPSRARVTTTPEPVTPALLLTIRTLGGVLDDLERVRVANGNRLAAVEREHGRSLPHLEVVQKRLREIEHESELELVRAWRRHPLAPWAKSYRGLGEKSIARLIAIIGAERIDRNTGEVRRAPLNSDTVSQLWAYCGFGAPERIKIPKNATQAELMARGNPRAKKQAWLIATSMLKAGNREVYDATREKYAALEITDGHKHARAIRAMAKTFLRDLWVEARADLLGCDIQSRYVGAGVEESA